MLGYGVFWVWYQSTGYIEVNQFSYKPQDWPGYMDVAKKAIPVSKAEIDIASRTAAEKIKNPLPDTSENIKAGKELFLTYCAVCHGKNGEGKGVMGSIPNLAAVPKERNIELKNYLNEYLRSVPDVDINYVGDMLTDGEIFYIISYGGESIMPSLREELHPRQRWQVINFIKWRFNK